MALDFPESHHPRRPPDLTSQLVRYVHDALKRRGRQDDSLVRVEYWFVFELLPIFAALCNLLCKSGKAYDRVFVSSDNTRGCNLSYAQQFVKVLHQKFALTFMNALLRLLPSTVERVGEIKFAGPK
jgi:hypothetical protein